MILFLPIRQSFAGSVANASGQVTRWTYTVPTGKRAELYYVFLRVVENPAITIGNAYAWVTIGTVNNTFLLPVENAVQERVSQQSCLIDLSASDTVTGVTYNASASSLLMGVYAFIREYQ